MMPQEPKRIQRRRTKGWKMPEGAIYVGRPTRWGSPYRIDRLSAHEYVGLNPDGSEAIEGWGGRAHAAHWAVNQFALHIGPMGNYEYDAETLADLRARLGGRDLACWCPLDLPCHADVLLELANRPVD